MRRFGARGRVGLALAILASGFSSIRARLVDEARLWLDIGAASLERIEARPLLRAWWLQAQGELLLIGSRPADAVDVPRPQTEDPRRRQP